MPENTVVVLSEVDRIAGQIEKVKALPVDIMDEASKKTVLEALQVSLKNAERAKEAAIDRAKTKLFIQHFINGCPECAHGYRASTEEVTAFINMREASSQKL